MKGISKLPKPKRPLSESTIIEHRWLEFLADKRKIHLTGDELQEARLLPVVVEHFYDMNWIIDEKGILGEILKSLFGYNGNPSLLEVAGYIGYLAFAMASFLMIEKGRPGCKVKDRENKVRSFISCIPFGFERARND